MNAKQIACAAWLLRCLVWPAAPVLAQTSHDPPDTAIAAAEHAGVEQASTTGESPNPMVFDPDLAFFSGVVFLLLVAILGKYAWPAIAAALDERERKIADNIAAAEAKHEEAKRSLAEYEAKLAFAAGEVRELLEEARRDAESTKNRIMTEARKASEEEKTRALREIERAKDGAIQELAHASAKVAIDLAQKVVREDLTANRQSQIVREALNMMKATGPSRN
jgi:F-type H+-transporting ATPase subunit b